MTDDPVGEDVSLVAYVRTRSADAGVPIPEERLPHFVASLTNLRAILAPLRGYAERRPRDDVFGGFDGEL